MSREDEVYIPALEGKDIPILTLDHKWQMLFGKKGMSSEIREMAVKIYQAIDCAGMARVDFLYSEATGEIYVSEVNTIPGFTSISMYPKLWQASGIDYPDLLDELVSLALTHQKCRQHLVTNYL